MKNLVKKIQSIHFLGHESQLVASIQSWIAVSNCKQSIDIRNHVSGYKLESYMDLYNQCKHPMG